MRLAQYGSYTLLITLLGNGVLCGKLLFCMARPERFELPTFWFVARHSIQLSYGRFPCKNNNLGSYFSIKTFRIFLPIFAYIRTLESR